MAKKLEKGDQVTWRSHGSEATGAVEQEITADTEAAGRTVRASGMTRSTWSRATRAAGKQYTRRPR